MARLCALVVVSSLVGVAFGSCGSAVTFDVEHEVTTSLAQEIDARAGDMDGDGDLDIISLELGGPARVWENTTLDASRDELAPAPWLGVRLAGSGAQGARLELSYEVDGAEVVRHAYIRTAAGFQASAPLAAHLVAEGYERGSSAVLRVRWLGGELSELELDSLDRWMLVQREAEESR